MRDTIFAFARKAFWRACGARAFCIAAAMVFGSCGSAKWQSNGKRFEHDQAETFFHRWEDQRVGDAIEGRNVLVRQWSGEDDLIGKFGGCEMGLESGLVGAVVEQRSATGDDKLRLRFGMSETVEGQQDIDGVFARLDAADGEEYRPLP
jgi:hypothetical protein